MLQLKRNSALHVMTWVMANLLVIATPANGHGRLLEPPSRASMWRQGFDSPANYDDNQLFCGGVGVQYSENGGKCGVCGDPWNGPREHEAGGRYANGIIVRKYKVGDVITATVELTANHKGFFEFRLCPTDNPFEKIKQSCLNKHPLKVASTGKIRYYLPGGGSDGISYATQRIEIELQLPDDIKCRACLLQWKYNAGNSWGVDPDGTSCIGCGNQEQFYGCADVAIGHDDVVLGKPAVKHPWYFQGETEIKWHIGVIKYKNSTSSRSGADSLVVGDHSVYIQFLLFVNVLYVFGGFRVLLW
ncbi:unnamed protein product [Lymnaea stagnalis]|uniref:Chitin-binding type-4 domain-containing protein n=1 Tax=Lymnaea stagnalis TaxID=6523 RepID=A0AAV2HHU9_LYMST